MECYRTGVPVIVADLAGSAGRWPVLSPTAVAAGFRSVHAFPMRARERVIGALDVFSAEPMAMDETDIRTVQVLADVATVRIIQQRSLTAAEALNEQLQCALDNRIVVEQAKGMVSESLTVDVDEAFARIRRYSRRESLRLIDVSRALLERALAPEVLDRALAPARPDGEVPTTSRSA